MFPWPEGKRAALAVTFDMDAEAAVLAVDEKYARRPSIMTHQQYGPVTAVPRLLKLLAALEIRASFFIPGLLRGAASVDREGDRGGGARDLPPRLPPSSARA